MAHRDKITWECTIQVINRMPTGGHIVSLICDDCGFATDPTVFPYALASMDRHYRDNYSGPTDA